MNLTLSTPITKKRKWLKLIIALCLIGIVIAGSGLTFKIFKSKWNIWLPAYIAGREPDQPVPEGTPIDLMVCFVDHFEPHVGWPEQEVAEARVDEWVERYPQLAAKHRDADGIAPQHTWFYPFDQMDLGLLNKLSWLASQRLGEIELHYHHLNHTEETLTPRIEECKRQYSRVGAMIFPGDPFERRFGFIHGNWALDNSIVLPDGKNRCGVNNELLVLSRLGCYADFTFPAVLTESQPRQINRS